MSTPRNPRLTAALSADQLDRLLACAGPVDFPEGTRLFEEGGYADRFWIVRTGTVTLDVRGPGRRPAVVDRVDAGELLGWSWLFEPYRWRFGAEAMTRVRAHEFDAATVRMLMDSDPRFGFTLDHFVGQMLAHRLFSARVRLLDLYAPTGAVCRPSPLREDAMPASRYTVSDVMTHTAIAIGRDAPYKEIVALMDQWKVSALPVLEGEGRVIGVVSEADLLQKEEFRTEEPRPDEFAAASKAGAVRAGELMSSPTVTVHPDATLAEAARIMATRKVKRLPVVSGVGMLEGVVSRSDLLKVFLRADAEIEEDVRRSVLGEQAAAAGLDVEVTDGVATVRGPLADRSLVPLLARAVGAVEGVVDVRMDLGAP